jgi:hypothetical protein
VTPWSSVLRSLNTQVSWVQFTSNSAWGGWFAGGVVPAVTCLDAWAVVPSLSVAVSVTV